MVAAPHDDPGIEPRVDPPGVAPTAFAEQLARGLRRGGWDEPARLVLEGGRPLAFFAAQALWLAGPALGLIWPRNHVARLAALLETPEELDRLLVALEAPFDA